MIGYTNRDVLLHDWPKRSPACNPRRARSFLVVKSSFTNLPAGSCVPLVLLCADAQCTTIQRGLQVLSVAIVSKTFVAEFTIYEAFFLKEGAESDKLTSVIVQLRLVPVLRSTLIIQVKAFGILFLVLRPLTEVRGGS